MNGSWVNRSEKMSSLARALRKNYELWNYEEILLPAIEKYDDSLDKGTKFTDGEHFYLVKPDITSQILNRLSGEEKRKLFYLSEVLDGDPTGSWQFGAEYIGGQEIWMVVEILTTIITGLEKLGIEDFLIDIGTRKVWESVTEDLPGVQEKIFTALHQRSFEMIDDLRISEEKKDQIWHLFNFRDKDCDYGRLSKILEVLDDDRLFADFGTVRGMSYYQDLTFEIYSPRVGSPLGGGGEYRFREEGACGFAFNLESLLELFPGQKGQAREKIEGNSAEGLNRARKLIKEGTPIEVK